MNARTHYVYRAFDDAGRLLYVGCSGSLKRRHAAHRASSDWWQFATRFTISGPYPKDVALDLEARAIETEAPAFNGTNDNRRTWARWSTAHAAAFQHAARTLGALDRDGNLRPELVERASRMATNALRGRIPEPLTAEHRLCSYLAEVNAA